jgi:hypothetical protein
MQSAIKHDYQDLYRLQSFSVVIPVPPNITNDYPSCAMITGVKGEFSILSTCSGLCLFRGSPSDLKMVQAADIDTLNQIGNANEYKVTSSNDHFYVATNDEAGDAMIYKLNKDGVIVSDYRLRPRDYVENKVISIVCDGEWVACSYGTEKELHDEVDIIERSGKIILLSCDDDWFRHEIVLEPTDPIFPARGWDHAYDNPIMLSPSCFVAGRPDNRKMFLIKKYDMDGDVFYRVANWDETLHAENQVVWEITESGNDPEDLSKPLNSRGSVHEKCSNFLPKNFRDFQRLNSFSAFFYPFNFPMALDKERRPIVKIFPGRHKVSVHGTQAEFKSYDTFMDIASHRVPPDEMKAIEKQAEDKIKRLTAGRSVDPSTIIEFIKSEIAISLLDKLSREELTLWEVCALLTRGNPLDPQNPPQPPEPQVLQISAMFQQFNDEHDVRMCEPRTLSYELNDNPVALCRPSDSDDTQPQFCLTSFDNTSNTFLFERFLWGELARKLKRPKGQLVSSNRGGYKHNKRTKSRNAKKSSKSSKSSKSRKFSRKH